MINMSEEEKRETACKLSPFVNSQSFFLSCSFAGGTWDWEYLGFASPEVKEPASVMFQSLGLASLYNFVLQQNVARYTFAFFN